MKIKYNSREDLSLKLYFDKLYTHWFVLYTWHMLIIVSWEINIIDNFHVEYLAHNSLF